MEQQLSKKANIAKTEDGFDVYRQFAQTYFTNGFDEIAAYESIRNDDKPLTASYLHNQAKAYLNHYIVRKEIDRLSMEALQKIDDDCPRIATELKAIAYFDPINLFTDEGDLKPLSQIPEATRRALAGIEIDAIVNREGVVVGHNKKIKLCDKEKALRMLGEWKKNEMFVINTKNELSIDYAAAILDARKRFLKGELAPIEAECRGTEADVLPEPEKIVEDSFMCCEEVEDGFML